jgi:uncharacterized repeat protein (TIGR03803 family)
MPVLAVSRRSSKSIISLLVELSALLSVVFLMQCPTWAASTEKVLHTFTSWRDGATPIGALIFDNAGNLYGTTVAGGTPHCGPDDRGGCGTVFQLAPGPDGTWKEHVLYRFPAGADGAAPYGGVILDAAGNLYGTTAAGGNTENGGFGYGTAFELSPSGNGWTETLLHTFAVQSGDGESPVGPLTFDKSGNLYGTTYEGLNPCGYGTIFQLARNPSGGWTENVLHCFSGAGSDGTYPDAGVIFDGAGNLYTPTYIGGTNDDGTLVELTLARDKWAENVLYDFGANSGGGPVPYSSLVVDSSGNLYGVTYGAVYELAPSEDGWTYTTIYKDKGGPHGIAPNSLLIDKAGNLYGTAEGGASSNCHGGGCGAVFKLSHTKDGWHLNVLYSFPGGAAGADPYGGLAMDQQGNLYGTTYDGGKQECPGGCGVVFEIIP